jgi:hypothetical protein
VAATLGYHYERTEEGTLVVEMDTPTLGWTTITWAPSADAPTDRAVIVCPSDLFAQVADSYIGERDAVRAQAAVAKAAEAKKVRATGTGV